MMTTQSNTEEEYKSSQLVQLADPTQQYFLTSSGTCRHNQKNIHPDNEPEKCKKFPLPAETFLVFYEMGGKDLQKLQLPANTYTEFFKSLANLFKGLEVLHSKNIVHLDIKSENVVARLEPNGTYKTRFIDFGLARDATTLTGDSPHVKMLRDFNIQTPYPYYPLDLLMTSPRRQMNPEVTPAIVNQWYTFMKERTYDLILPNNSYWRLDGTPLYNSAFFNREFMANKAWYRNIVQHLKSVDVYSMGITLAEIWVRFTGHYRQYNSATNKVDVGGFINGKWFFITPAMLRIVKDIAVVQFHLQLADLSKFVFNLVNELITPLGPHRPSAKECVTLYHEVILAKLGSLFSDADLVYRALQVTGSAVTTSVAPSPVVEPTAPQVSGISQASDPGVLGQGQRFLPSKNPAKLVNVQQVIAMAQNVLKKTQPAAHQLPPRPKKGWIHVKNATGRWYWKHANRGHPQTHSPILGYLTHINNASGNPYYENLNTGKTQWEKPNPKARRTRKNRR